MGDVILRLSAEQGKAVQGFLKLEDAQRKLEEGFKRTGRASRDAGGHMNRSMSKATREAGRFIGAVTGIGGAVGAVAAVAMQLRKEYENLIARQKAAADLHRSVGDVRAEALRNLPPNMSVQKMDALMDRVSKQYQVPPQALWSAGGSLSSAKGAVSWPSFVSTVEQLARLRQVGGPEMDLVTPGGAALDIMRITGLTNASAAFGWQRQIGVASRMVDPQKQARSIPPVLAAAKAFGWTPEQSAEILAYATQAIGDVEGRISSTGTINFMQTLMAARTKEGALIPQRIGDKIIYRPLRKKGPAAVTELQDWFAGAPEDLREIFLSKLPGRAKVKGAWMSLIARDPQALAMLQTAQEAITDPNAPGVEQFHENYFTAVAAGKTEPVRAVRRAGENYVNQALLDNSEAMAGAVREEVRNILSNTRGIGELDRRVGMFRTEWKTNIGREDAVGGYIDLLRDYQGQYESGERMGRRVERSPKELFMAALARGAGDDPMEPTAAGLKIAERLGEAIAELRVTAENLKASSENLRQATDPAGSYVFSPEGN